MRRPGPDKTVSGMLDALKNWDTAALAGYIDVDQLYADANIASENQDQMTEILKLIMKNLSYEILDTQVSGDTAVVTVSITNTNMSVVITEYFTNVLVLAFSGNYSTDAELESAAYDLLQTSIQNHMDQTITNQVDVQLTKQDGQWVTTMSDELMMPSTAA
jgi:adenine-specific DNA methylase